MKNLLPQCICGGKEFSKDTINNIAVLICSKCKIVRQFVPCDEKEFSTYYSNTYCQEVFTYTQEDSKAVALKRLKKYNINPKHKVLDVGYGNGAFVDACEKVNINITGQDINGNRQGSNFYNKKLKDVNFPTDDFDVVTCHDVLEHILDPIVFLKQIFRIVNEEGTFILDFPNFYADCGTHHWKLNEHLWMLSTDEVVNLLVDVGFVVHTINHPICSKVVFYCTKPKQNRISILVPSGIGDIHWVLVKLRAFMKEIGISLVDLKVVSIDPLKDRSADFVKSFPFVKFAGYVQANIKDAIWNEAYIENGRTIFRGAYGCDYFIAYNGRLRYDLTLDEIDPQHECNWEMPRFVSNQEENFGKSFAHIHGDYIIAYFVDAGMYKNHWLKEFNANKISHALLTMAIELKKKVVVVGASWDIGGVNDVICKTLKQHVIDMTGKTSLDEVFSLMKNADGLVGFPSGLSMMSAFFDKPTLLLWNDYFCKTFWYCVVSPKANETCYKVLNTKGLTSKRLFTEFNNMLGDKGKSKQTADISYKQSDKPIIACVYKSGGDFTPKYVQILKNSIKRNTTIPFDFVCLTDKPEEVPNPIELVYELEGWWNKLELFRPDLFKNRRVIYFDLDTIIHSNIDSLLNEHFDFAMLGSFNTSVCLQSGIMCWTGDYSFLLKKALQNPLLRKHRNGTLLGDQRYIHAQMKPRGIQIIQDRFDVCSWKWDTKEKQPSHTSIVCFHGSPRPHEVTNNWINKHWRL